MKKIVTLLLSCLCLVAVKGFGQVPDTLYTNIENNGTIKKFKLDNFVGKRFGHITIKCDTTTKTTSPKPQKVKWWFANGSNVWRPNTGTDSVLIKIDSIINPATDSASAKYQNANGGISGRLDTTTKDSYYTFNVTKLASGGNEFMTVLKTSYKPDSIINVSLRNDTVKFSLSKDSTFGQHFYVRYTKDNWATSVLAVSKAIDNQTFYSILPQICKTDSIQFYAFSSKFDSAKIINMVSTYGTIVYDLVVLSLKNDTTLKFKQSVSIIEGSSDAVCLGILNKQLHGNLQQNQSFWKSLDTSIVKIDSSTGSITTKKAGNTIIWYIRNLTGCSDTAKLALKVNDTTVTSITGNSSVCKGSSITLTGSPNTGSNFSFVWSASNFNATVSNGTVQGSSPGSVTIMYTATNNTTSCVGSAVKTITVNALPIVTLNASNPTSVCKQINTVLSGNQSGTGVVWASSDATFATINNNGVVNGLSAGNVTFTYTYTDGNTCKNSVTTGTFTVHDLPSATIVGNNTSVCQSSGTNPSLVFTGSNTSTSGSAPSYTFYFTKKGISDSVKTSSTSSVAILNYNTNSFFDTAYTLNTVKDKNGCLSTVTTSNIVNLQVHEKPVITPIKQKDTICSNTPFAVNWSVSPVGTKFTWVAVPTNVTNSSSGSTLTTATSLSQTLANTSNSLIGWVDYTINPQSPSLATCVGNNVIFTVYVNPVVQITNPTLAFTKCDNVFVGSVALTTSSFNNTFNKYSWNYETFANANLTGDALQISDAVNDTISFANLHLGSGVNTFQDIKYKVRPSFNNSKVCYGRDTTFTFTVNPIPTVNAVSSETVCDSTSTTAVTFGGSVTQSGIVYNWVNSKPSVLTSSVGVGTNFFGSFVGANKSSITDSTQITVTPVFTHNAVACSSAVNSKSYYIVVNPVPTVNAVSSETVCHNASTTAVTFGGSVTQSGIVYNWINNKPSVLTGSVSAGTNTFGSFVGANSSSITDSTQITVTPVFTHNAVACSSAVNSKSYYIVVNPVPTVNTVSSETVCHNASTTAVTFGGSVTQSGIVYNWINNKPSVLTGSVSAGTNTFGSFVGANSSSITDSTQIMVTPVFTHNAVACSSATNSKSYYVVVNPIPTVNLVPSQTVCHNDNVNKIVFTGATTQQGVFYEWQNINSTDIGFTTYSDTNKIAQYVGKNITRLPITANFRVTPKFTHNIKTCIGGFKNFTVTVNPNPSLPSIPNMPTDICSNTKYHNFKCNVVDFPKANEATVRYNWTVNGANAYVQDTSNYQENNINYGGAILSFGSVPNISVQAILATGCKSEQNFIVPFKSNSNTDSMNYDVFYYAKTANGATSNNFVCANNNVKYLWGWDDKSLNAYPQSGEIQQNYRPKTDPNFDANFYWVKTTNIAGCISKNYFNKPKNGRYTIIYPTVINTDLSIQLSPNPVSSQLKLKWNNEIWNDEILITVSNILGKVEMQKTIAKQANIGTITLNTVGFSTGLHLVSITSKGERKGTAKFIQQ